jgi:hypothetical protein
VRLSGKFPGPGGHALVRSSMPTCLVVLTRGVIPRKVPATSPAVACPPQRQGQEPGPRDKKREPDAGTDVSAPWVRLRQQGKGRFSQTTASTLMAGADQLRLPVLTSDPAACQEPGSTHSMESLARPAGHDPRR